MDTLRLSLERDVEESKRLAAEAAQKMKEIASKVAEELVHLVHQCCILKAFEVCYKEKLLHELQKMDEEGMEEVPTPPNETKTVAATFPLFTKEQMNEILNGALVDFPSS